MEQRLSPKRPFLLRAYYDWIVDNNMTPYLIVDATYYGVVVPQEYVQDGQIVLNLSTTATGNLILANDHIQFNARFRGIPQDVYIPMGAALAIYSRENGDGVMFEPEALYDELDQASQDQPHHSVNIVEKEKSVKPTPTSNKVRDTSHLRIIK